MTIVPSDYNVQGLSGRGHELWESADYLSTIPMESRLSKNVAGIWAELLLRHISIELYLKSLLVHKEKIIYKGHNLDALYRGAEKYLAPTAEGWLEAVSELNPASDSDGGMMRYPKSGTMSYSSEQDKILRDIIARIKFITDSSTLVPTTIKNI